MKKTTLVEHIENANDMAIVMHHMNRIRHRMANTITGKNLINKLLDKLAPKTTYHSVWGKLQCKLDTHYHALITDEQFDMYGHIYYNLDKRYKRLQLGNLDIFTPFDPGRCQSSQMSVNHANTNNK